MNTSRDVNPLDEFFRNSLENLPDTPGASGWDTPSDRVWQQVQGTLKTPPAGGQLRNWVIAGVVGVAALAGLYLVSSPKAPPVPVAQPGTAAPAVVTPPVETAVPSVTTAPVGEPARKSSKPAPKMLKPEKEGVHTAPAQQPDRRTAAPLPGSKEAPHNTKEANDQKRAQDRNNR